MKRLFDAIIRGCIERRRFVVLAALALIGVGVWAGRNARFDALPSFMPPVVAVQAEASGLGTTQVERLVTRPLEQALLAVPGATTVRSTSAPGLAVVHMTFAAGTDIFRARQLVAEHLADARERLPPELPPPRIAPIAAQVGALLKYAYTAPRGDSQTLERLWRFAHFRLEPRLEALEGVAQVIVHGGAAVRVEVRPNPAAMLAHGVGLGELRRALGSAQTLAPMGWVQTGVQQQAVRGGGLWTLGRLGPIADTVVTTHDGLPVRVADVAQVAVGQAPAIGSALYDAKPAIYIEVDELPWADTLAVTRRVESTVRALDSALPEGTRRQPPVYRQADFIRTSLFSVGRAMALGAVFVIVVLVSFLRSWRLCAISLTALPLSIVAAATVLLLRGATINGMILGGLAIVVGEVIDDAIVDVENVWRRLRANAESDAPRPALAVVHDASVEVRNAVVYASLIVVVVLVPIMLLPGVAGRIFSPLAESYALAVAASLGVALTVTPALAALLLPRLASSGGAEPRLTRWLRRGYEAVLRRARARPGRIVIASVLVGTAAVAVLPFIGGGFLPEFRAGVLIAEVSAWPGTSLAATTRLARRITAQLRRDGGASHVAVRVGRASLDRDTAPVHHMEMDVVLPAGERDPEAAAERIESGIRDVPGVRFDVEGFLSERINELLSGERAPIAVKLYGGPAVTVNRLRALAARLRAGIRRIPGVQSVGAGNLADMPAVDLDLDGARIAAAGLRRSQVLDDVEAWRNGLPVTDVKAPGGFSVPLVIAGARPYRRRASLTGLPVLTSRGTAWPLSSLARVVEGIEPPAIQHEGGRRVVTVTARARAADLTAVAHRIEALAGKVLPASVQWKVAGQAAERRHASARLAVIALVVLAAVFVFLWMAFGSPVDASVVIGGIPLGIAGGVAAALLLPGGLSIAGMVGFVALSGIISRNGIMLVVHKNDLAERAGEETEQVVLQAARERLLPIVMTALTAFFGLLPLAASLGAPGSELESPMALIVCAGLLTSTVLNLVAVPAFYLWRVQHRRRREAGS